MQVEFPLLRSRSQPCLFGSWWAVTGLGARGLLYHAWLGRLLAAAAWEDSDAGLPAELTRWQRQKTRSS